MSRHASELCKLLVGDLLGDLAAKIFHTICESGRLPLDLLAQRTRLGRKQLQHGLAALIQQNLVLWDDVRETEQPYYEVCMDKAYRLSQYGRYLQIVEAKHGKAASQLLEDVLLLGNAAVSDLEQRWVRGELHKDGGRVRHENGIPYAISTVDPKHASKGTSNEAKGSGKQRSQQSGRESREDLAKTFYDTLQILQLDRLLLEYHESFHRSAVDNRREAEEVVKTRLNLDGPVKGAEAKAAYQAAIDAQLTAWKFGRNVASHGDDDINDDEDTLEPTGIKRKAKDKTEMSRPKKRPRLEESDAKTRPKARGFFVHQSRGELQHNPSRGGLPGPALLVVNFERLDVLLRDEALAREASRMIGPVTAHVYTKVLQLSSLHVQTCHPLFIKDVARAETTDDESLLPCRSIPTKRIADQLNDLDDLEHGIAHISGGYDLDLLAERFAYRYPAEGHNVGEPSESADEFEEDVHSASNHDDDDDDDDDQPLIHSQLLPLNGHRDRHRRPQTLSAAEDLVRQHLLLLSTQRLPFLLYQPRTSLQPESWLVPYPALTRSLRVDMICQSIHAQHDSTAPEPIEAPIPSGSTHPQSSGSSHSPSDTTALRISRILAEFGKLDEKTLAARSMVPPKLLRSRCAALHAAGVLEIQDVPRDTQRQAARSMFLWFLDPERAATRLVDKAMNDMSRLIERRHKERSLRKGVLDKSERLDVKGREGELLDDADMQVLQQWRQTEEKFWGVVTRLGAAVDVLKTF